MTPELLNAFDALKTEMCSTAALRIPPPTSPFILETDASIVALGAVRREGTSADSYPVAFFSIGLSKAEKNYSTYERELLATVKACEFFRVFLLGAPFTLHTAHKALAALFTSELKTSSRIVKWIMRLPEFGFSIEYIKGSDNVVVDALSRIPWSVVLVNLTPLNMCLRLILILKWNWILL